MKVVSPLSLLMPTQPPDQISLKRRVFGAGLWSIAGFGLSQLIRMGSNLLMTRLLVPDMFGVMAIGYLILTGLSLFSDVGLNQNIVQSERGDQPAFLNTAWLVQIYRGVLIWLFAAAIALALPVADHLGLVPANTVYADPRLPYVIIAISFTAVTTGLRSTKLYEANRYLMLGRVTLIGVAAQVAGFMCMACWAALDRSIWALVAGGIGASVAQTLLSHFWLSGTPNRWQWDQSASKEIFHFGRWIFISSILGFLASSGDRLILGSLIDPATLGVYVIAFLLFSAVEQIQGSLIQTVVFPALSEVVRKRGDVRAAYYRFHLIIAAAAYFCAGFTLVAAQAVVHILYDQRYAAAGWMLQILALGLLALPSRISIQCFMAFGASKITAVVATVRLVALLTLLPAGFYLLGLPGAVAGITLSYLSFVPTTTIMSLRHDLFDAKREALVLPVILVGIAAGKLFALGAAGLGW